jgi:hypothetical protein
MGCDPMLVRVLDLDNDRIYVEFPGLKGSARGRFSIRMGALRVLSQTPRDMCGLAHEQH